MTTDNGLGTRSAVACRVRVAGAPAFEVLLGADEIAGATPFGVDPISRGLQGGVVHDAALLRLMLALTRPGQTVVDLGAHVGLFTLTAASAGRQVLAVEASRRNVELLRGSVERNGFGGLVEAVHAAVSNRAGTLAFIEAGAYGQGPAGGRPGAGGGAPPPARGAAGGRGGARGAVPSTG